MKKILVTGCAGFIGFHFSSYLLTKKYKVFGVDNINSYYDVKLKKKKISILKKNKNFNFRKIDLRNKKSLGIFFKKRKFDCIVHLAAQAGVRYSLIKPKNYLENNIDAYLNIIEIAKSNKIKKIIYASSSSVYGGIKSTKLSETKNTDNPLQLYAVTKKTNELMSEAYKNLFNISFVGIRFFTVYGPWGRPDMALFKFTKNILNNKKITVYNKGNHSRNFTYIDDAIKILYLIMKKKQKIKNEIFNIASPFNYSLMEYIQEIEKSLGRTAKKNYVGLQKGDIKNINSDITKSLKFTNFKKFTKIEKGIPRFISWYKNHYKLN